MHANTELGHRALIQMTPPGQGGVTDFAQCLQDAWSARGIRSEVIALSKSGARERALADRIKALMADDRRPCSLVLHFSGYGYGNRGVCFWLLDELAALRAQYRGGLRLVVLFHELFANGPPWRSAFWVSALQERVAVRLAAMADATWTNTDAHARWLRPRVRSGVPLLIRPVISNVGEPAALSTSSERAPYAVVFGLASTRQRTFDGVRGHGSTLRQLGVTELIEVGSGPATAPAVSSIDCRQVGRLEQPELSRLLAGARFGLIHYPSDHLGKSGVFAAYAAHGCVVLNSCRSGPEADGLSDRTHYVGLAATEPVPSSMKCLEAMGSNLRVWYSRHGVASQASALLALAFEQPHPVSD
jgi:hypothetical protein